MHEQKLDRLAAAGIQIIVGDLKAHFILERDGFIALVEKRGGTFGAVGAAGLLTERGLAPLVWREERPFFVAKGSEQAATDAQIETLRRFQSDLEAAIC